MDRSLRIKFPNFCTAVAIFGLALCAANGASAQTLHGTLRGVTDFEIAVEPLDADANACGVREAKLVEAVKNGSENAGYSLGGYDYSIYVRISSLLRESDCFSSIDIEVRYVSKLPLPNYPNGTQIRAVLWSNGTIIISPRNQHGREVVSVITLLVKGLAEDWIRDNSRQSAG
jgi:hypothetical protein